MKKLLLFVIPVLFMLSCKSEGKSHRYLHDRKNPSEEIAAGHKKASKKADKTFHKNWRKNKKSVTKSSNRFFKKKKGG